MYLSDHPDANDTLEGIVHWWLLERKIVCEINAIREALSNLKGQGLIKEINDNNLTVYCHINKK